MKRYVNPRKIIREYLINSGIDPHTAHLHTTRIIQEGNAEAVIFQIMKDGGR